MNKGDFLSYGKEHFFLLCKQICFTPGIQQKNTLHPFTMIQCFFSMHVYAISASIDLRSPDLYKVFVRFTKLTLCQVTFQSIHGLVRLWLCLIDINSCFHYCLFRKQNSITKMREILNWF